MRCTYTILLFCCFIQGLIAQDCPKAWMFLQQRTELAAKTSVQYKIEVPVEKIQIDFMGAPVGIPFFYAHKNYVEYRDLCVVDRDSSKWLHCKAYTSLLEMRQASGFKLPLTHCYRSYSQQQKIFKRYGAKVAEKAGYSEHHLYTAIDIKGMTNPIFRWMLVHAFEYGWIPSYYFRVDKSIQQESWHWRYVGQPAAHKFYCAWRQEIDQKIKKLKSK